MSLFPLVSMRGLGKVVEVVMSEKAVDLGLDEIHVGNQYSYGASPPCKKSKITGRINT